MKYLLFIFFSCVFFSNTKTEYLTYFNARFDYSIKYPSDLLIPQKEAENGDGKVFTNKIGEEKLRVWGTLNLDNNGNQIPIKSQYQIDLKAFESDENSKLTYKFIGRKSYVISGTKNGLVYYRKVLQHKDAFIFAVMQYSDGERKDYDRVVETIMRTFK